MDRRLVAGAVGWAVLAVGGLIWLVAADSTSRRIIAAVYMVSNSGLA